MDTRGLDRSSGKEIQLILQRGGFYNTSVQPLVAKAVLLVAEGHSAQAHFAIAFPSPRKTPGTSESLGSVGRKRVCDSGRKT